MDCKSTSEMDLGKIAKAQVLAKEATLIKGVYSVDNQGAHINEEEFFNHFTTYEKRKRDCETYPFEYSTTLAGAKFFCISKVDRGTGGSRSVS